MIKWFNLLMMFFLFFLFIWVVCSCAPKKELTIHQEPTIWIVSEIYYPKSDRFNGMIGYKFIPVNPGYVNAKPTWKLDYKGKYYVGQRVDFAPLVPDMKGVE